LKAGSRVLVDPHPLIPTSEIMPPRHPRRALAVLLALAAGAAARPASAQQQTPLPADAPRPADGEALAAALRRQVGILADDSLAGRKTGERGGSGAAAYLAREAAAMGLLPAGDSGTFFQRVPLEKRRLWADARATRQGRPIPLKPDDVTPLALDVLPATTRRSGSGKVVYYGHILDESVPEARRLTPEQMAGSVVVVRSVAAPGQPAWAGLPPIFALRLTARVGTPVVAIILVAEGAMGDQLNGRRDLASRGRIAAPPTFRPVDILPVFVMTAEVVEALLGRPLAEMRHPEASIPATFGYTLHQSAQPAEAFNVVARLPGSGSGGTWVAAGAHYDHMGAGTPVEGDSVYNGADDNASGVAALLEAARGFARQPRERRPGGGMLFLWYAAEEFGLLGSAAFVANPTVPRDSIVGYVNLDMVGRNARDSLRVLGPRRMSAQLLAVVDSANARLPRPFVLDHTHDGKNDPLGSFCRSDQVAFARAGIPVAFLTSGLHADYHRPSDEASTLDYDKIASVTLLTTELMAALADRPRRPLLDFGVRPASLCQ
jgi:hypothetical protein